MVLAGESLVAGRFPGERIATDLETADSAAITAETVVHSVTAALVNGRTYRIVWNGRAGVDTTTVTSILASIREDSISGTIKAQRRIPIAATISSAYPVWVEAFYTASSTASKTFVGTLSRSGTGNVNLDADANDSSRLYVEYVEG